MTKEFLIKNSAFIRFQGVASDFRVQQPGQGAPSGIPGDFVAITLLLVKVVTAGSAKAQTPVLAQGFYWHFGDGVLTSRLRQVEDVVGVDAQFPLLFRQRR
jgi:hypothetical protein